jgi:SAM-dependent methyltransferase
MRESWDQFYHLTKDNPPSTGLVKAVSILTHTGDALDLGCGAGRDTRYLLTQGFRVTAVDQEKKSLALLAPLQTQGLNLIQTTFEDFTFAHYDLINAHYTLPFVNKEQFSHVFGRLKTSLKSHGIFVGKFLGIHDTWNVSGNHMTFLTREQALDELKGLEIITFDEEMFAGKTTEGAAKHWHIYHIIVRKL